MKDLEPADNPVFKRLYLFLYLIPIFGCFPALWTLYRRRGSREQLTVSRLSVTLAGSWLLGYLLLGTAGEISEFLTLRLLLLNTLLTSGYFIVSLWLMVRLYSRQSPRLPGFSHFPERVLGKYLS
ncbi:MAG: hypothetical protein JO235_14585 [Chroococcidiopsidaceae cyanobacterium CP_BM_RX_35]|nr:hypothetical protein [Chroococcidiopsidaceae cyanobacterium CP_BM_RX_35]